MYLTRIHACLSLLYYNKQIALHTWPKQGVITLDVFTCGSGLLIPVLPTIKELFGISSREHHDPVIMEWSHKLRGFREGFSSTYEASQNPFEQDLGSEYLGCHDGSVKIPLVSKKTKFQHVDILENIEPKDRPLYEKSLSNDGSYESLHPELYMPDRVLFLDGVEQSSLMGEAAYHESLVHPTMLVHTNPKRVLIIGGGEGATLREVLRHKSVEEVVMVDIDEELVNICREFLPEWNSCADMEGSDAKSCFDDSRSTVLFEDAFAYIIDNFSTGGNNEGGGMDQFDGKLKACCVFVSLRAGNSHSRSSS